MTYSLNPQSTEFDSKEFGIKDGEHVFAISGCDVMTSQSSGAPYIQFEFMVVGPTDPEVLSELKFMSYFLSEKAVWRLVQLCRAVDPNMSTFDPTNRTELAKLMLGRVFVGNSRRTTETWNGKDRTKFSVDKPRPCTSAEHAELVDAYGDDEIPASLVRRFNGIGVPNAISDEYEDAPF